MPSSLLHIIIIQQDDMLSDRSSSPENRSLPPSSPLKRNSGQNMGQVPTDPYARVDVAKKAYERQKKAELEKRWRLNSGMSMNKIKSTQYTYVCMYISFELLIKLISLVAADEPQKEELNVCVKKITRHIYALLEAHKATPDK